MRGKGVLLIGVLWSLINLVAYLIFDVMGLIIVTYSCMILIWLFRKYLIKKLKL
jgi:hypothetical protein